MKLKRRLFCVILSAALALGSMTACNEKTNNAPPYDSDASDSIYSSVVASNSSYELTWDDFGKFVILENTKTGRIWSTIPYDYYMDGGTSANVNSTLNISISNTHNLKVDNINGFTEAYTNGRILAQESEDGLTVTYYFDRYNISVPVDYRLIEDGLEISVDPAKISEGDQYLLVSVTPAPFFCSAYNADGGSYLFIPTGSGALMYAKETVAGDRSYTGEIYGTDGARLLTEVPVRDEAIRLPVFGVKDGSHAMLAVINEGAESAEIEATSGNNRTGLSNVSAKFYLRAFDRIASGIQLLGYSDYTKVAQTLSQNPIKITYYPLEGDEADYNGMAKRYRQYLTDTAALKESKNDANGYGVKILGGIKVKKLFLGVPVNELKAMTTFSEAGEMVEELLTFSDMTPEIMLSGFGNGGITPGKVAGGYKFPSVLGGNKGRLALENLCKDKGVALFTDFDLIQYNSSGSGFSYSFDAAKSASLRAVEKYPSEVPLKEYDKENRYRVLKRAMLKKAAEKLVKKADSLDISGVSLATLGGIAYSDYSDGKYYAKANMAADVSAIIDSLQTSHRVAVSAPNAYAAAAADALYDVPTDNGGYLAFDESIPFYQMVFGGKAMYCNSVNLSDNMVRQVALAVSSGTRLSYTIIKNFENSFIADQTVELYGALFDSNKEQIEKTLTDTEAFYASIKGAAMTSFENLAGGISKTVFDNGVVVYTNHNSAAADSPVGRLEGYGFKTQGN